MRRGVILIIAIVFIVIATFLYKYKLYENEKSDINKFNKSFLEYNREDLYGTDITTLINKAIDNNEQKKIKKDKSGMYISDDKYSIKIFISLQEEDSNYPMEKFEKVGIQEFTTYFGELNFKCTKVTYHENGRISEMFFQSTNY